jgi:Ca2+-binding RTX toxin-like protein
VDGNSLAGVVLTANAATTTQGSWQWLNGTTWTSITSTLSSSNGLFLTAATTLRFLPAANFHGTPGSLSARLVDSSAPATANGSTLNVSTSGGLTPYSTGSVALSTSITPVNDAPTGGVSISGNPTVGQVLTASNTLADNDGIPSSGVNYQWWADFSSITGATNRTYILTAAEIGKKITVTAAYRDNQGKAESVMSAATAAVSWSDTVAPTLIGVAVQGNELLLQFSEAIDSTGLLPDRFSVSFAGVATSVTSIAMGSDASQLTLALSVTPTNDQTLTLTYSDLSSGNDSSGVAQDLSGNDLAMISPARNIDTFISSTDVSNLAASYTNLTLTGSASSGTGNAGNNVIQVQQTTPIANLLNGGAGTDSQNGGDGSDIYLISTSTDHPAAEINDTGTTGIDELRFSSVAANQTLTVFSGDKGLEQVTIGTGTAIDAILTATTALNINANLAPNSLTIIGNAGINSLVGTAFADVIIGGAGNDSLNGGNGSDIYLIASSTEHGAAEIKDTGTSGIDELRFSSITANQTLVVFAGDTGLEQVTIGTGMAIDAVLTATTPLNINARLAPKGLKITGNAGINSLVGTAFADVISGGDGNDSILGGLGKDILTGGTEADIFRFDTTLSITASPDIITDFSSTDGDVIQLENAVYTGLTTTGTLVATAFANSPIAITSAHRILYDVSNGRLLYDSDGNGSAPSIIFATIGTGLALNNTQFIVT